MATTAIINNNNNTGDNNATSLSVASKRVVYVGGLGEDVTQQVLRSAMIPFGPLKSVDIPMDYKVGKTRGFAFVEFGDPEDAAECVFNMDRSDLCGRTIKVSLAQQNQLSKFLDQNNSNKGKEAIWSSDDWFREHVVGTTKEDQQTATEAHQDKETLQD